MRVIDHMINSPQSFITNQLPTKQSFVQLPNGQFAPILFSGNEQLSPALYTMLYTSIPLHSISSLISNKQKKNLLPCFSFNHNIFFSGPHQNKDNWTC